MEKCKFCQADLAENGTFCPNCGRNNAEEIQEGTAVTEETAASVQEAAAEITVEETPAEETAAAEEIPAEAETPAEPEKKKATPGKIALAVGAVVVLIAVLIALLVTAQNSKKTEAAQEETAAVETVVPTHPADGNPDDATCKGTYTVSDEDVLANRDTVVATIGDTQLTNGQLQVYYWSMVNSYLSSEYGYYTMMYGALDYTQPLDTQISVENTAMTWQQYFLQEALNYWQMCTSLAEEAKLAGVEMNAEDREYLDNLPASLEETAAAYGMTLEELLRHNVGPGAGLEDFVHFQSVYMEGKDFYKAEQDKMVATDEELEAYFTEHEEAYASSGVTRDGTYVDVRHILVKVEGGTTDESGVTTYSDEEWAACEAEAQAILDEWLAGDMTEDSFAALANEKSEDPGSNTNGGLYENVYKGQMVEPFETWCFDETRTFGDYGLVKTSYGYHVMFFVSSEPMWLTYAKADWKTEESSAFLEELIKSYPIEVAYDKISLGYIQLGQ